jgi:hypothetical protein
MKKLFLLAVIILFFSTPVFAACNYESFCPQNPETSSNIGQLFSQASGSNFIAEQFVDNYIKQELKKATGQDFNVDIKAFSISDLLAGKFRSLSVNGQNVKLQGLYMSSLTLSTACNFNYIDFQAQKPKENMVLSVHAEISGEDLKNSFKYGGYAQQFNSTNFSPLGLSSCKIYTDTINMSGGRIFFTVNSSPYGNYKPFDISVAADINIADGKVITSQISFINIYAGFDLTKFSNWLNPKQYMSFPVNILGNNSQVKIQDIKLSGNKAYVNAFIIIPKS